MTELTIHLSDSEYDYDVDVEVTHFHHQPPFRGSAHLCDSSSDYYGYTEIDFDVLHVTRYSDDFEVLLTELPRGLEDELNEQVERLSLEGYED